MMHVLLPPSVCTSHKVFIMKKCNTKRKTHVRAPFHQTLLYQHASELLAGDEPSAKKLTTQHLVWYSIQHVCGTYMPWCVANIFFFFCSRASSLAAFYHLCHLC